LQKNKTIAGVITTLLLIIFAAGVVHLFVLRFETGDVYPAYSSLRSDPLGTRALYESLENIDSLSVHRNYHLLKSLSFEPQTTFFYLGASADEFNWVSAELIEVFDRLTRSGGRLVLTFLPVTQTHERKTAKTSLQKKDNGKDTAETKKNGDPRDKQSGDNGASTSPFGKKSKSQRTNGQRSSQDRGQPHPVSIKDHWGIGAAFKENLPVKDDKHMAVEATSTRKDLPPVISWHTNLYFDLFDGAWQTLYSYKGLPLIVERPFGKGSILVCADSYFLSNEALWSERHPRLLVWLIGAHSNIIFEEAHFGIFKQPSVAQLIRRYRFHWFFAALAVLALLFVWKSAAYFVPPSTDDGLMGAEVASEKDYTRGLIALLRRNVASSQILQVCAGEWVQTFKKSKRIRGETLERMRGLEGVGAAALKKGRDPVTEYREISQAINRDGTYSRNRGKRI
jgi:hypothetical protein